MTKGKQPVAKLIKKADKIFAQIIHKRGQCQKCGSTNILQTAHVIPRTNKTLRWSENNALLLCYRCHIYWAHKNPLEFNEWFQRYFPIQYAFLMREKNKLDVGVSNTIEFTIKYLEQRLKQYDHI